MKKIILLGFIIFSTLLFSPTIVHASNINFYKTTTNKNIIYVAEKDNKFVYSWQFNRETYKDDIDFSLIIKQSSDDYNIISNQIDKDIVF